MFDLPDEMIGIIVDYLDSFTIITCLLPISKQFYIISQPKVYHLEISDHDRRLNYQLIYKCSSFVSLTSLNLINSSIGAEDFTTWIKSGNLKGLKKLMVPRDGKLALEIGKMYNECIEKVRMGVEVDYSLPNLKSIQVENVCKLDLINPLEYCKLLTIENLRNVKASCDLFGKVKEMESLKEMIMFPPLFPKLFEKRSFNRNFLLYGPMKSGKRMILETFHKQVPSNFIEPCIVPFNKEISIRTLFTISRLFGKHVISLLIYQENLFHEETEGEANRRSLTELVVQLDDRRDGTYLFTFFCSNRPMAINSMHRKRLFPRLYIKLLTGEDLSNFLKYQIELIFGNGFIITADQLDQTAKLFGGYSPYEIENILKSMKSINQLKFIDDLKVIIEKSPPMNTLVETLDCETFLENFGEY